MWCLTFAGLLVTGTRAFAPAPRQWDGLSARRFVLATKVLPNMDLFPHKGIAPPLTVTIHEQTSGSPENFEATGLCLEANRDVLRVNRCHGLPTQLWSFLHSDNKGNNQLQLQGTSFCIHADARYGLHDVVAELQECAHESAELLALEEPIPLPTRKIVELSSTSWSMRYAMLSFVTLAVLGAYGLISLFRWLRKARPVVADRCNTPVTNDQGGVCSIVLLDVGQCATPFVASFDGSVESAVPAVMSMSTSPVEDPYQLTPILPHFAAEVRGFSLDGTDPLKPEIVQKIKEDMNKYRVLVFKDQGQISGARQVQISKQLGVIESTFYKHPRSPHPDIFRVSNDESEGCTGVGRTGWHIDGTFQEAPFKYQTMHFHSVCEEGETWFVPLSDFYDLQDEETKQRWNTYWMITGRGRFAHPMVYKHPTRQDTTLMFHCGKPFCAGWAVYGADEDDLWHTRPQKIIPPDVVQQELTQRLDEAVDRIGIKMNWAAGDFAINDNLGNCHYAAPGTQNRRTKSGLRILHRTTIAGEVTPQRADGRGSVLIG